MPVVCKDMCLWFRLQGRRQFTVVVQRPIPMVFATTEFPQLRVDTVVNGALIFDSGSGMCKARFPGFSPRFVFPLVVGRPTNRSVWTRNTIL